MGSCCHSKKKKFDFIFWGSLSITLIAYILTGIGSKLLSDFPILGEYVMSITMIVNEMWWGLLLGIFFVGFIGLIPRNAVIAILGKEKGLKGILRAAAAGVLLDLCSHGILLVGMKLYERGASLAQLMAFLIASPWNSLSLTVILIALIGFKWTIIYIFLSLLVAIISGMITEYFVDKNKLPANPNRENVPDDISIVDTIKKEYAGKKVSDVINFRFLLNSFNESKMVLRWIFFGVAIAGLIRVFVPDDMFSNLFGPTMLGLWLTLIAATIIEVCSEGSVPIAYDIFTRAAAPGNAFLFLMVGVSTDYTEILALRETTKSWKIALFLPIVTLPQILILSYILNLYTV